MEVPPIFDGAPLPRDVSVKLYLAYLDEQRDDLSSRRKVLEEKAELRRATRAEFDAIHERTARRGRERLRRRHEVADRRNQHLLLMAASLSKRDPVVNGDARGAASLATTKQWYEGLIEREYPRWQKAAAQRAELRSLELQRERQRLEEHRSAAHRAFEKEMAAREALDEQRREMAVTRTKLMNEEMERGLIRQQLFQQHTDLQDALQDQTLHTLERLRDKVLSEMETSRRDTHRVVEQAMREWQQEAPAREAAYRAAMLKAKKDSAQSTPQRGAASLATPSPPAAADQIASAALAAASALAARAAGSAGAAASAGPPGAADPVAAPVPAARGRAAADIGVAAKEGQSFIAAAAAAAAGGAKPSPEGAVSPRKVRPPSQAPPAASLTARGPKEPSAATDGSESVAKREERTRSAPERAFATDAQSTSPRAPRRPAAAAPAQPMLSPRTVKRAQPPSGSMMPAGISPRRAPTAEGTARRDAAESALQGSGIMPLGSRRKLTAGRRDYISSSARSFGKGPEPAAAGGGGSGEDGGAASDFSDF